MNIQRQSNWEEHLQFTLSFAIYPKKTAPIPCGNLSNNWTIFRVKKIALPEIMHGFCNLPSRQETFSPQLLFSATIIMLDISFRNSKKWHLFCLNENYLADLTIRVSGLFPKYRNRGWWHKFPAMRNCLTADFLSQTTDWKSASAKIEFYARGCFNCSENISQAQNSCELVENGLWVVNLRKHLCFQRFWKQRILFCSTERTFAPQQM